MEIAVNHLLFLTQYTTAYFSQRKYNYSTFQDLLEKVSPFIAKKTTNMRLPITPGERLSITLRYLGTGESFRSLGFQFRVHWTTVSRIIPEVLEAIFLN